MWELIAKDAMQRYQQLYEVVLMDPAYRIKQGVPYETVSDEEILKMPIELVQERGILIMWFVNQKKDVARQFMKIHGYDEVEKGEWIKLTKNQKLHKGSGMYTAHNNESFLIGKKGYVTDMLKYHVTDNVIFSKVGKHSEKPQQIYDFIQQMAPDRLNLEVFARPNNIRNNFTSFGNQLEQTET
ncbi:MT-A70 family protein [Oxytricha trifallax]|uniref:mRNA m(6)A methyltransferase n=1 Tax=Oxytricha trifallax TaxID=1172189 RepID=A0A073IAP7_9SPIT|nr:MT-A70 family protein [Oxytricha trifallax]